MTLTKEQMQRQVKATAKYEANNIDKIVARVPIGVSKLIKIGLGQKPGGYASRAILEKLKNDLGEEKFKIMLDQYKKIEKQERTEQGKI